MKKYNRIMLGQGSKFAKMCHEEGYIAAEFDIFIDPCMRIGGTSIKSSSPSGWPMCQGNQLHQQD